MYFVFLLIFSISINLLISLNKKNRKKELFIFDLISIFVLNLFISYVLFLAINYYIGENFDFLIIFISMSTMFFLIYIIISFRAFLEGTWHFSFIPLALSLIASILAGVIFSISLMGWGLRWRAQRPPPANCGDTSRLRWQFRTQLIAVTGATIPYPPSALLIHSLIWLRWQFT